MTRRCDGVPCGPTGVFLPTARGTLATDGAGWSYRETRESQERRSVQPPPRFRLIWMLAFAFSLPPSLSFFPSMSTHLLLSLPPLSLYTSSLPSSLPLTFINSLLCARLCAVQQGTEMEKSAASLAWEGPGELLYSP